jgi:DNA repair protein RAD5
VGVLRLPVAPPRGAAAATPQRARVQDLYPLMRFLRYEPWDDSVWWNKVISRPHAAGDPDAILRLRMLLKPIVLQRSKVWRAGGRVCV